MARKCTICHHHDAERINRLLVQGETLRAIEDAYDISSSALSRHKTNHITKKDRRRIEAMKPEMLAAERTLSRPEVKQAVAKSIRTGLKAKPAPKEHVLDPEEEIDRGEVIGIIQLLIRSNMRDFMSWDAKGNFSLVPSSELGEKALAIRTWKSVGGQMVPVLHSKDGLLKLLAAEAGLTTDSTSQTIRIVHMTPDGDEEVIDLPPVRAVRGFVEGDVAES